MNMCQRLLWIFNVSQSLIHWTQFTVQEQQFFFVMCPTVTIYIAVSIFTILWDGRVVQGIAENSQPFLGILYKPIFTVSTGLQFGHFVTDWHPIIDDINWKHNLGLSHNASVLFFSRKLTAERRIKVTHLSAIDHRATLLFRLFYCIKKHLHCVFSMKGTVQSVS